MNTNNQIKATASLAAIFAFRMLGLFMILPVFPLYADHFKNATPALIGMALGIYGLTQALFQMPLGMLSDRLGRKSVITLGLVVFALGSVIAGFSTTIYGVIIGRAIQGAGAVGSAIIALVADLTLPENRTKAMAVIGMTIGLSFAAAIVLGPLLNPWIHLSGIFFLTAILAISGIAILHFFVPHAPLSFHSDAEPTPSLLKSVLFDKNLLRLDIGILALHCILTATFLVIPITLSQTLGIPSQHQWYFYLTILLLSFILMVPLIIVAEKHHKMKSIFLLSIATLVLSPIILILFHSMIGFSVGLLLFFTAFNLLEASLPSLISKTAPLASRGTAMGVYSSSQFFGIFLGGSIGGWILGHGTITDVLIFCITVALLWLVIAISMPKSSTTF